MIRSIGPMFLVRFILASAAWGWAAGYCGPDGRATGKAAAARLIRHLEEEHGIIARQNYTCCLSDGNAEIRGEIRQAQPHRSFKGYVFYHEQDTEGILEKGMLFLAFGAVTDEKNAQVEVGQCIVTVLEEAGFTVEWNGTTGTRIKIKGLDWKKRRELCT